VGGRGFSCLFSRFVIRTRVLSLIPFMAKSVRFYSLPTFAAGPWGLAHTCSAIWQLASLRAWQVAWPARQTFHHPSRDRVKCCRRQCSVITPPSFLEQVESSSVLPRCNTQCVHALIKRHSLLAFRIDQLRMNRRVPLAWS
jgi:hypothetical protein